MNQTQNKCPQCGASIEAGAKECKYCGESFALNVPPQAQVAQPVYVQPVYVQQQGTAQQPQYDPNWPIKNKTIAGVLGILLGGFGVHKFYMGKIGMGILYLLFCWTGIPELVGLIEGIIYLCSDDHNFQVKNRVRLG